jgi:hypothetical protein
MKSAHRPPTTRSEGRRLGDSTKAFMHIEHRWSSSLTVAHVAESYQHIIDAARAQVRVAPDAPVVLTGWSRGASLAVLVASSRDVAPVIGLVAIGLAASEQLDINDDSDDDVGIDVPPVLDEGPHARSIAMYPLLSRMAPRRSVVIQASRDGYQRARASCSGLIRRRDVWWPSTRAITVSAVMSRRLSRCWWREALGWVSSSEDERR